MPRAGSEYQEIVALVAKALDPEAKVKIGQWVEGPDGKREIDVQVYGTVDGAARFVLIECKDWKNPVDIEEIDKLDSKRKDLSADIAIIYSNSGFTKKAIKKASRIGIETVSALASDDQRIKIKIYREFYAKGLSVDNFQIAIFPNEESIRNIPEHWDYKMLYINNLPVANWLHELSRNLIIENESKSQIKATFAFKRETLFQLNSKPVILRGISVIMKCSRKWFSQTVQEDVSLGFYDHIEGKVIIPNEQVYWIGEFDINGWKELDDEPEELKQELEPNSIRFNMVMLKLIPKIEGYVAPPIDTLINEKNIEIS